VDDAETLPAQLCRLYQANIYNGSRRWVLLLLASKSLRFDSVIFTAVERTPLSELYCAQFYQFKAFDVGNGLPDESFRLPDVSVMNLAKILPRANEFFFNYLKSRLIALTNAITIGLVAPPQHELGFIHRYQHVADLIEKEVECARMLKSYFLAKGIDVGFLFFPVHETIYGEATTDGAETLSFIDRVSKRLAESGLRTMNTKACLIEAKSRKLVYQIHDSHLNGAGLESIAECLRQSDLFALIDPRRAKE
jgi:hypothetical protein